MWCFVSGENRIFKKAKKRQCESHHQIEDIHAIIPAQEVRVLKGGRQNEALVAVVCLDSHHLPACDSLR
jgi:hypothetical protein